MARAGTVFESNESAQKVPLPSSNIADTEKAPLASEQDESIPQLTHDAPNGRPPTSHSRMPTKPVVPIIPLTPFKPQHAGLPSIQQPSTTTKSEDSKDESAEQVSEKPITQPPADVSIQPKAPPKSWAELLRSKGPPSNGGTTGTTNSAVVNSGAIQAPKNRSLYDALHGYDVEHTGKVSFLEPRGLVNTGNMCYMNSVSFPAAYMFCYSSNSRALKDPASTGFLRPILRVSRSGGQTRCSQFQERHSSNRGYVSWLMPAVL